MENESLRKLKVAISGEDFDIEDLPELGFEIAEIGNWVQDSKWQYQQIVVKDSTGLFFAIHFIRSGSPFTDWYYDNPYVYQVEKEPAVTYNWKRIN